MSLYTRTIHIDPWRKEFEAEAEFHYQPGCAATHIDPGEGPCLEDLRVTRDGIKIHLTRDALADIEESILEDFDARWEDYEG